MRKILPGGAGIAFVLALLPFLAVPEPAQAAIPLESLFEVCEGRVPKPDAPEIGRFGCQMYVGGLLDAWQGVLGAKFRELICLPAEGIPGKRFLELMHQWAAGNEQRLKGPADPQIFNALERAFPCPKPAPQAQQPPQAQPKPPQQPQRRSR